MSSASEVEEEEEISLPLHKVPDVAASADAQFPPDMEVNIIGPPHLPLPSPAPPSASSSSFPVVGSRIEGQLPTIAGVWFFGTVVAVASPGEEYLVMFDDARKNHKPKSIPRDNLRKVKGKPSDQKDPYAAGDFVWGMFKGHNAAYLRPPSTTNPVWYSATIDSVTSDKFGNPMYTVKYDDDGFVETMHTEYVRRMMDKEVIL